MNRQGMMDDLRGFGSYDDQQGDGHGGGQGYVSYDDAAAASDDIAANDVGGSDDGLTDDVGLDAPPVVSGDERRMQVRAYNFWTDLLHDKNYPDVEDLDPGSAEFCDNSVLLDFTSGMENPSIQYLGQALRAECEIDGRIGYLDEVPARSLLTRITDHYLQIIANRAPIGFEAEFVNQRGLPIMYRGILLPFSTDDDTIDFIYGVINWKEAASAEIAGELQLEVEDALRAVRPRTEPVPVWADAPSRMDEDEDQKPEAPVFGETGFSAILSHPAPSEPLDGDRNNDPAAMPDADAPLAEWLDAARGMAARAQTIDLRSRSALYAAIGMAYDVALATEQAPDDYAALLADVGLKLQARAPMTPVVKLVFGADYDKTRLTEYAATLSWAKRQAMAQGALADALERFEGGLKGLVRSERQARRNARTASGQPAVRTPDVRGKLRTAAAKSLDQFADTGEEFMLLVARRQKNGALQIIGNVDGGAALTEKALRKTVI